MRHASFRTSLAGAFAAAAILIPLGAGRPSLAAPGVTGAGPKTPVSGAPAVPSAPPEVADRLKRAGLDAKDPNLGAKLKTLAAATRGAYAKAHVMSMTAGAKGGAAARSAGPVGSAGGAAGAASVGNARAIGTALPAHGTVTAAYDDKASKLGSPPPISTQHGQTWQGRYFFAVETKQKIAVKGGPGFSPGATSLSYGCSAKLPILYTFGVAADDPNYQYGLPRPAPANGTWYYYVDVSFNNLPIGRPRTAQATFTFENVAAQTALSLLPTPGTAKVSVTIERTPQLGGVGTVYPWGSTGLSGSNAKLDAPSTPRVGGGNWQTQTQGDDLVGVGAVLGPGWKVTSAKISGAVSLTSSQDGTPDNVWRGAKVTTPPQGSDLRTAVHWHYSGVDTLDYTVEWDLEGPLGQRPLLTMAKYGDCDS